MTETYGEHAARVGEGPCLRCVGKAVIGPTAASPSPSPDASQPLAHRLCLVNIRKWVDEGIKKAVWFGANPQGSVIASEVAAAVWLHVQAECERAAGADALRGLDAKWKQRERFYMRLLEGARDDYERTRARALREEATAILDELSSLLTPPPERLASQQEGK